MCELWVSWSPRRTTTCGGGRVSPAKRGACPPRLAHELPLQLRFDRRTAKMRVDVRIAFLPQGLADVVDVGGAARQLEGAFDDVVGLHINPAKFRSRHERPERLCVPVLLNRT